VPEDEDITSKDFFERRRAGDEPARQSESVKKTSETEVLDAQADVAVLEDDDPHRILFEAEFVLPSDPHQVEAAATVQKAAPKKKAGKRSPLQVGGSNAVEGLGKVSIRHLTALPGGGVVVVSSETPVSDAAAESKGSGLLTMDDEVAARLAVDADPAPKLKAKLPKTFESEVEPEDMFAVPDEAAEIEQLIKQVTSSDVE
jgi:hypothetical protein